MWHGFLFKAYKYVINFIGYDIFCKMCNKVAITHVTGNYLTLRAPSLSTSLRGIRFVLTFLFFVFVSPSLTILLKAAGFHAS